MAAGRSFGERHVDPNAVCVPAGFRIEVAATGLNNPSSVDFDESGDIFVAEMGSPTGSAYERGRIVSIQPDGSSQAVADDFSGSITALAYHEGAFYTAEHAHSSRIYRVFEDGTRQILMDGLPGGGDHPTSDIVVGHSGMIYFGQGTRTNSGVVGPDNAAWLVDHPELYDIPGADIVLAGKNFEAANPFGPMTALTGAFKPFGVTSEKDEIIRGDIKCSGGIMRADPDDGEPELFAWGLRRPYGLSVHADGRIFCTDIGMEDRGSRRIADGHSYVWQVMKNGWYGWPDYAGGEPVTDPEFRSQDGIQPEFLLAERPPVAGKPVARLPRGSGIAKFDFSRSPLFASDDTAFTALTGEATPSEQTYPYGFKVVALDIATGEVENFAANRHPGPASVHRSGGLERPIAVKFDRTGEAMYILDLGILVPTAGRSPRTLSNTGVLWRVTPTLYTARPLT